MTDYNLMYIDEYLPVHDRDDTLRWLKHLHTQAMTALRLGHGYAVVIDLGFRQVLAKDLVNLVDTEKGIISRKMAQLLIDFVKSDMMPLELIDVRRSLDMEFYAYAMRPELMPVPEGISTYSSAHGAMFA